MNQQLIQGYTMCSQDDEIISVQKIIYMLLHYLHILIQVDSLCICWLAWQKGFQLL